MYSFVVLYRGWQIDDATPIAASSDPALVEHVARTMIAAPQDEDFDLAVMTLEGGRRGALTLMRQEAALQCEVRHDE